MMRSVPITTPLGISLSLVTFLGSITSVRNLGNRMPPAVGSPRPSCIISVIRRWSKSHTLVTALVAILCGLLTIEHAWSRDHVTSSATAVLPPPGRRCETVRLNSFGNRTSPSDNSNDPWQRLCLVSWAAAPCVWTLRSLTRNLITYLTYLLITIVVMYGVFAKLEQFGWYFIWSRCLSDF